MNKEDPKTNYSQDEEWQESAVEKALNDLPPRTMKILCAVIVALFVAGFTIVLVLVHPHEYPGPSIGPLEAPELARSLVLAEQAAIDEFVASSEYLPTLDVEFVPGHEPQFLSGPLAQVADDSTTTVLVDTLSILTLSDSSVDTERALANAAHSVLMNRAYGGDAETREADLEDVFFSKTDSLEDVALTCMLEEVMPSEEPSNLPCDLPSWKAATDRLLAGETIS